MSENNDKTIKNPNKYFIDEDPMQHLDEADSKIMIEMLKKTGEPIKYQYLDKAIEKDGKITFNLDIEIIKKKNDHKEQ
jgi:hypothetical protein